MLRQIVAGPISELALRSTRDLTVRKIFKISSVVERAAVAPRPFGERSRIRASKGEFTRFTLRSIALDESRKAGALDEPIFYSDVHRCAQMSLTVRGESFRE